MLLFRDRQREMQRMNTQNDGMCKDTGSTSTVKMQFSFMPIAHWNNEALFCYIQLLACGFAINTPQIDFELLKLICRIHISEIQYFILAKSLLQDKGTCIWFDFFYFKVKLWLIHAVLRFPPVSYLETWAHESVRNSHVIFCVEIVVIQWGSR